MARLIALASLICGLLIYGVVGLAGPVSAREPEFGIGFRQASWTDASRGIKATMGFAGADTRRLDVMIWYPTPTPGAEPVADAAAVAGHWPLVLYSHGTNGSPNNAMHIVRDLVRHGYVVAAPAYPLSSLTAFTHIRMSDPSDVINQVKDVRFLIDQLLADPFTGALVDPQRIGIAGHSLGAVTSYFAVYGGGLRDPRIKAVALTGPGDPVQTALSNTMGMALTPHAAVSVPVLFLTADKDVFARTTGQPFAAYERVEGPKFQLLLHGGVHVWFRDGDTWPKDNKNPDCEFFEKNLPGLRMPGCEERVPLIGPARQQAITRAALRAFFDGYLKGDARSVARLKRLDRTDKAIEERFSEH